MAAGALGGGRRLESRLLDTDFPDRAFMARIAEHNLIEALALLPR